MMEFGARLSLKDNMYATLHKNLKQQKKFQEQVKKTREHLGKLAKQKVSPVIRVKDKTQSAIQKVKSRIKKVGRMVATPFIKVKNSRAISGIGKVSGQLKKVGRFIAKPIVKLKDGATQLLKGMGRMLKKLAKGATIAVGLVGAGATVLLGGSLGAGAKLEQQQISIEHFIGVNNKKAKPEDVKGMADEYINQLRNNANLTPFTTNEVISAGTRAVNIAGGDTGSAMGLLKVAEDMASLNPEKSLSDAIEAIADMKNGETERMKEFGFKISADDIKKAGGTDAIITNQLAPYFEGGAQKLAGSASGLVSTIKGKIGTAISNTGLAMIENSKPLLEKMVVLIDKMAPKMEKMGEAIADGFSKAVDWASELVDNSGGIAPIFSGVATYIEAIVPMYESIGTTVAKVFPLVARTISRSMSLAMPYMQKFYDVIQRSMPIVQNIITVFCNAVNTLMPVVSTIFEGVADKVGAVIDFISSKMGFIQEVFDFVVPLISEVLTTAWSIIEPIMDLMITVFEAVWEVIEFVFPAIQAVIETVWGVLEPIFSAIAKAMDLVGGAVKKVTGWFGNIFSGVFGGADEGAVKAPSKAVGVNRVPRDNYLINAHQGEMLLNRVDADRYQKGKNTRGVPYNPVDISFNKVKTDKQAGKKESNFARKNVNPVVEVAFNGTTITKDMNVDELVAKMVQKFNKITPNMA